MAEITSEAEEGGKDPVRRHAEIARDRVGEDSRQIIARRQASVCVVPSADNDGKLALVHGCGVSLLDQNSAIGPSRIPAASTENAAIQGRRALWAARCIERYAQRPRTKRGQAEGQRSNASPWWRRDSSDPLPSTCPRSMRRNRREP